ncbi:accessory factor UbiK family protein [Neisseria meningitidis]|uniref:accessory factor UbiK family protein n=1 Tax=Neisseria meningitidis TaxID=487 RepID=UPI000C34EE46|nr:accessory factor UbiK family protein [Neisseria meningitidis]MBW4001008.1 accessory factor UbiK family protein [Neisseria meningitidis]
MFGKQLFEEVGSKISETIANSPAKDVEKNIKAMLGGAFNRMDLVTREEFDIQQQVLIKTRTKLAALEARLAKLEAAAEEAVAEIRQQTEAGE